MKEYLQTFKDYWSFILIAIYSVAYLYNYSYYSYFDVNIFQYTTITDLLFFSIEQIFLIGGLLLLIEIIGIVIAGHFFEWFIYKKVISNLRLKTQKVHKKVFYTDDHAAKIVERFERKNTPLYLFIYSFFIAFFSIVLSYLPFLNLTKSVVVTAGFTYLIYKSFKYVRSQSKGSELVKFFAVGSVYVFAIAMIFLQSIWNASDVINEKATEHNLSFNYQNKLYKIDNTLRFIGETTTYIFLYNKTDESTLIFPKTKVDNLKINAKDSFLFNRVKNDK